MTVDQLTLASQQVRQAGYQVWDTYTPFPVHGIDRAMGIRRSRLPWLVLVCGLGGMLIGLLGQSWLNSSDPRQLSWLPNFLEGYDIRVSGKPLLKIPAFIPVTFELTILSSALAAFCGLIVANRLPRWYQSLQSSGLMQSVTSDRLVLRIGAEDPQFVESQTSSFLSRLGGSSVERVVIPQPTPMPAWLRSLGVLAVSIAIFIPAVIFWANVNRTPHTRFQVAVDMDNQERFKAQQANPLFADGRAMRAAVAGTIARVEMLGW